MTAKNKLKKVTVILMTYGSPKNRKEVPQYLKNVYGGRNAPEETIKEFRRRYKLIGGSPLIKITKQQAKALQKELNKQKLGTHFSVTAGMRFSDPFIEDVIKNKAKNADKIVGIIMSPQYSPIIMKGYLKELKEAVDNLNQKKILKIATDWHLQPYFLQALAERVKEKLQTYPQKIRNTVPVLFSAHSMPKRVIDKEPNYISDLKETAAETAALADLKPNRWMFCYQSAGHTPEEWLKPDFADIMPELQAKGEKNVLIAPVQFLSDHLEILYDVGIGAREQAEEHGIIFNRTESLNTSPLFIKALAEVVKKTMAEN
ncbi:MAG TPA: ferrochelatase [Candidatus Acidoferrales bacterium]|nr:ferrochelatase [Candidatus Acidoferrales bacterium]